MWTPVEIATEARIEADAYQALIARLGDGALGREIAYVTTEGTPFETPLGDILDHVLPHGAHHRGQACMAIRASGQTPPWVDLMAWVRLDEPAAL